MRREVASMGGSLAGRFLGSLVPDNVSTHTLEEEETTDEGESNNHNIPRGRNRNRQR